jgi:hypothetical protein
VPRLNAIRRLILIPLAASLWAASSPGQTARSVPDIIAADVRTAIHDAVGYYTAPFSFGGDDWTRAAAGAGALGAFMAMDEPLNRLMARDGVPGALETPFRWGEEWGRLRTMQFLSAGVYVGGLLSGSDAVRVTGRLMGEALVLSGLPAIALQYGLGRSRPVSGRGAWDYHYLEWGNERQSLPSGHVTVAFAISTVLAKRIGETWAVIPLYSAAGLTALSLGWTGEHWPSDLLIGAALGYLAGSWVADREEERAGGGPAPGAGAFRRLEGGIGPGGITVRYRIY